MQKNKSITVLSLACLLIFTGTLTAKTNSNKKPATPVRLNNPISVQRTLFQDALLRQKPQTAVDSLFFPDVEVAYQPLELPVDSVFILQPGPGGVTAQNQKWEYRLGGGQFRTAEAELFHWNSLPKLDYGIQLNYQRSDNEQPNSGRQEMGAAAMVSHQLFQGNRLNWRAEWNQQELELQRTTADTLRKREFGYVSLAYPFSLNPRTDIALQADFIHHKVDDAYYADDAWSLDENEIHARAQASWQHSHGQVEFSGAVRNISVNRTRETTSRFSAVALSTSYQLLPKISAVAGLHYFNFSTDGPAGTNLPGGKIRLNYLHSSKLGAFAQLESRLEYTSNSQNWQENPLSLGKFEDFATKIPFEFKSGIAYLFKTNLHCQASVTFSEIENYGFYNRTIISHLPLYLFTAYSGSLQRWNYHGAIRLTTRGQDFIEITANYLDYALNKNSVAENIPFTESVNMQAQLHHTFSNGVRLTLQPRYIGSRYADLGGTQKLAAIWPVDVNLEWQIKSWLNIYVEGVNCLNEKYEFWPGYLENGFQLKAGIVGEW